MGLRARRPAVLQVGTRALVLRVPPGAPGSAGQSEHPLPAAGLDAACEGLRALLRGTGKTPLAVHLACGWSRLLLLPWLDQLTTDARWRTYAQARFEQVYGEDAGRWELHLGIDGPGRDRMLVAWPLALRDTLAEFAHVRSVRVALLEHLGVLLSHERAFCGCLIEMESDGAGFVLLVDGIPKRVRWCRFDDIDGLASAVRSEWASVLANETGTAPGEPALALTPPAPKAGSERAANIGALATGLGFGRAFSLPDWP